MGIFFGSWPENYLTYFAHIFPETLPQQETYLALLQVTIGENTKQ